MRADAPTGDHRQVSATLSVSPPRVRRCYRRPDKGLLGGVATGLAEHIGISTKLVRVLFLVFCTAGGLGVALYGAYWIVLPPAPEATKSRFPAWLEFTLAAIAGCCAIAAAAASLPFGGLVLPTTLALIGAALIWRQASEPERDRLRALSRSSLGVGGKDRLGRARIAAGAALIVGGAVIVLARADVTAIRDGLLAGVVTLFGIVLLTGPWWIRLMTQLGDERSERIRSQERADIAAHLHDSVLQTLALIQRNASSPREVARLARGQERELRTLLYGDRTASGQVADALRDAAGEVEDAYAVTVDVVLVGLGDTALTERLNAAVAAAREAMVNAAKHSGVTSVSLYGELEATTVVVFVRDRGKGFDPDEVAGDRHGVRASIIDRVERHGGTVRLTTAAGSGTEIQIRMPVS